MTWLNQILRLEYAAYNITFRNISPGFVATNLSTVTKTSFFCPNPHDYVQQTLRTVGNAADTTGYFAHEIFYKLLIDFIHC